MGLGTAPDPAPPAARVKRLRDKYEAELSELEQSERKLQERCVELKGRLGEAEGENVRLQGLVRQKEKELADVKAVSGRVSHPSPAPSQRHPLTPSLLSPCPSGERAADWRAQQPGPGPSPGVRRPAGDVRRGEPAGQGRAG